MQPLWYPGHTHAPAHPRVVAIGNFDGVHLGHQTVLRTAKQAASERGLPLAVTTFDPAPTAVLAPERHQPRICTLSDRIALLHAVGVDLGSGGAFTPAFAAISAENFGRDLLVRQLMTRVLVVGHDFRFGQGRQGNAERLRGWCPELEVREVEALSQDGVVSSSRIRKLVAAGKVEEAGRLLGRPHWLRGLVVQGDQRGRTLGFPTANLQTEVELLPAFGVYATRVEVDGLLHPAVTNIGLRPTFSGKHVSVESHLLDFQGDLYGKALRVELVARIREEQKFASLDALVAQIRSDVATARERLWS
ncbi:MAG TPA: bifunctional riboflavin kinase/FAD synthetase [Myxococcota bacterium]|nr:bifunctional riboflavin kinase/FAD synthetase [Myxococcota bacterium]